MTSILQLKPSTPPNENILKKVFSDVVGSWADLVPHETGALHPMPKDGALEFMALLKGPQRYHLVVRVPHEFALIMVRIFNPDVQEIPNSEDAFAEVVSMYCGHLKDALWGAGAAHAGYPPRKSSSKDWPSPKPGVACHLRVGAFPVEIFLWALPSPGQGDCA